MAGSVESIVDLFKNLPTGKLISLAVTIIMVVGGFVAILIWANRPEYQVLFSNLDTRDAAKITEKLQENRTPFQLKDGGRAVLVPNDMVYQLRLELASEGIPRGSSVGFEILDDISFGTTEFVQKLRYQQALQGELARTIMQFDAIDQARVHIVPAGDSLFAEPEKPATASIVIRSYPGRSLNQQQLQGIINLVACAVEGLKPENVSIVDMEGGMLSKGYDEDSVGNLSRRQFEFRRKIEDNYEKQIQTMLEPVVGVNHVVARVTAEIDLKQVNITEEKFDPDSVVVRSEQREKEISTDSGKLPSGSPDLKYDVYQSGVETEVSSSSNRFEKENSVINYEINRVNRQVIDTAGEIKRLSAAVIIDGPYVTEEDPDGNMIQKFVPRDRKQMRTFEDIVKKAVGFNEERGDQVTVSNIAFSIPKESMPELPESHPDLFGYAKKLSKPLLNIGLILIFFIIAIRPFKRWLSQTSEYVATKALPQGEEPESDGYTAELEMRQKNKQKLIEATKNNPDVAADIIKTWINEVS